MFQGKEVIKYSAHFFEGIHVYLSKNKKFGYKFFNRDASLLAVRSLQSVNQKKQEELNSFVINFTTL
jgi:hypothetical protein